MRAAGRNDFETCLWVVNECTAWCGDVGVYQITPHTQTVESEIKRQEVKLEGGLSDSASQVCARRVLAIVAFACGCASRAHQYRVPGDESSSSSVLGFAREIEAHALGSVSGLAGSESVPTLLVS